MTSIVAHFQRSFQKVSNFLPLNSSILLEKIIENDFSVKESQKACNLIAFVEIIVLYHWSPKLFRLFSLNATLWSFSANKL